MELLRSTGSTNRNWAGSMADSCWQEVRNQYQWMSESRRLERDGSMDELVVALEDLESLGPFLMALVRGDLLNLGYTLLFHDALGPHCALCHYDNDIGDRQPERGEFTLANGFRSFCPRWLAPLCGK